MNKLIKRKNWVELTPDEKTVSALLEEKNISKITAKTIINRSGEEYKDYIETDISSLNNPLLLPDMDKALTRILKAVESKENIVVYGDYDVDGITSTYILYDYLLSLGCNVSYFIPDRMDSGYGLSDSAIESLNEKGAELIITVDLGISAVSEAKTCKKMGIDLIITDHHSLQEDLLPDCIAVINPKINDSYPFHHLAGAGVAFKLVCALCGNNPEITDRYLPYAAIGTIADLVELKGENRYIAKRGLELLKSTDNIGLLALFETAKLDINSVNSSNIGYAIGPRLNAAGRIASASISVGLLAEKNKSKAKEIAEELDAENEKRKATEQEILRQALDIIKEKNINKDNVIVVANQGWHHGIIGIVSSRITDTFYKPSIVMSIDETSAKASGRSIKGFNLFDALDFHKDMLVKYGGHELAAGLTISNDNIDTFTKAINDYAKNIITEEISTPSIYIDDSITIPDINLDTFSSLEIIEPCGMGNRAPLYAVKSLIISSIKHLKDSSHSFITVCDQYGNHCVMPAFGMQETVKLYREGNTIDVAGVISENVYNSRRSAQFIIKDIRPSHNGFINREAVGSVYRMVKNSVSDSVYISDVCSFEDKLSKAIRAPFGILKLIVCLDVLSELGMIEYTLSDNEITLKELSGFFKQTNLEKSSSFVKYVKKQTNR